MSGGKQQRYGEQPDFFELADDVVKPTHVLVPGRAPLDVLGGQRRPDGLAFDLSGPQVVRAVQLRGVGFAATRWVAAAVHCAHDAPPEDQSYVHDLGHEVAVTLLESLKRRVFRDGLISCCLGHAASVYPSGMEIKQKSLGRLPTNPFEPVPLLFLAAHNDSELRAFLQEVHQLAEYAPDILAAIDADLDLHGKRKKALRIQDAQWIEAQRDRLITPDGVPIMPITPVSDVPAESLVLEIGRRRTPAYLVYLFMAARGYFGGYKSKGATTLVLESMTLRVVLANAGLDLPGRSTLTELANAVSNNTREMVLDAQLAFVLGEGWDDFKAMTEDSTAVAGNVLWPTDSRLMVDLVARLYRRGGRLDALGLPNFDESRIAKVLGAMSSLDREISLSIGSNRPKSARLRQRLYKQLLKKAKQVTLLLAPQVERTRVALRELDVLPSQHARAARLVEWLETDLKNLRQVVENCEARVVRDEKVPMSEKVLSVSDPDVGYIAKGGREAVVGYKPNLARSENGFVTGLIVPQGNASDSGELIPMFEQVVRRTGVIPGIVSVDDGYSSAQGRAVLLERGVKVVSISGSKGKKITPAADWESEAYAVARDYRSAVESLMFTIKYGFDFDRVARRGLENVRAELLEKVLAYNFCRMAVCRTAASAQEGLLAA